MEVIMKRAYAEVFEILKYMDRKLTMKIPAEIIEYIKENKEAEYISKIDKNDIFNKENVEKKTLEILAWLNINYWAESKRKEELIKQYRQNDINYEENLKKQFEGKELFREKEYKETRIIMQTEPNILQKFIDMIKKLFKRI